MKKSNTKKVGAIVISAILLILGIVLTVQGNSLFLLGVILTSAALPVLLYFAIPTKTNGILKAIIMTTVTLLVLSWIVPISQFTGTEMAKADLSRIGLFDLINYPLLAFQYFYQMILFILVIGGMYGVLNKTGKYTELLEKIAKKLKGKEKLFLVITSFLFAGFSSVFGFSIVLFIFVPMIVSIVLLLGYDKMVALLTTVISVFVGMIGSTYSLYVTGYINQILGLTYNESALLVISKIALFVIPFVLFMLFTLKYADKVKKSAKNSVIAESIEDKFLGEKAKSKKKAWPIIVVLSLLFIVFFMGSVPWSEVFGIKAFSTFNTWLTGIKWGDNTVIAFILGEIGELGTWYFGELTFMVLFASLILAIVYRLGFDGTIEAFVSGAKKVLKPAMIMALAMVVVIITAYHPFYSTITASFLDGLKSFNVISLLLTSIVSALGSLQNIEVVYMAQTILPYVGAIFKDATEAVALVFQAMYGLTMFVAPTSLMLILGLEYLEIPYKTWLKFSWKLVVELFVVILVILAIITLAI